MIGQKQVPSRMGGVEVVVEALSVRMAAQGHDVTLYNSHRWNRNEKNKIRYRREYKGVHIRELPVVDVSGISAVMGSFMATIRALFGKYDCIHYHAEGPAAMLFLPHFFGIRIVVTIHGLDWQRSKWGGFASWYLKMGEKVAAAYADEIIVLSRAVQQYFLDNYQRRTVLIPNGIQKPVKRAANRITQQWGLQKDSYILYLGRIVPEKGIEYLVRAFLKVKTDKKLVIAGNLSDTETFFKKLKMMAKNDERILFVGHVQGEILEELYTNSYIYCLPSDLEGMPISLLEAMSFGNCCVCSDIPECAEVIEQYGYLFKKGDVADLHKQLQLLCQSPELVENCRRNMGNLERYNWDETVKMTLSLYNSGN